MELTAKTLHEVTFGAKVRGYDPAEVDDFIAAVAEGVEELQERLRRSVERATRAEQAAAQAPVAAPVAAAPAPSSGGSEISKVWERAVAAADQALQEAKSEAQRLLDEARQSAESQTTQAREQAESQTAQAREQAESAISNATTEAARIASESQSKLRAELEQLEAARAQLKSDVDGLAGFLDDEKARLKGHIHTALEALAGYGTNSAQSPQLSTPAIPSAPPTPRPAAVQTDSHLPEPSAIPSSGPTSTGTPDAWHEAAPSAEAQPPLDAPQFSTDTVPSGGDAQNWGQSEWSQPAEPSSSSETSWSGPAATDAAWVDPLPSPATPAETDEPPVTWDDTPANEDGAAGSESAPAEEEGDPFLAELRKAVQDDGPLGPRDENAADESTIDSLYSSEDDDKSGFFRRKK